MNKCPECNCVCNTLLPFGCCLACSCKTATTSTLNGKWPSDTWFQRARALNLKQQAIELGLAEEEPETKNVKMPKV